MTRPIPASRLTQPRIAIALCLVVLVLVIGGAALLWEELLGTTRTQRLAALASITVLAAVVGLALLVKVVDDVRRARRAVYADAALSAAQSGSYDRVSLARDLDAASTQAIRTDSPLACVMVAVDHFSTYTQTQGVAAGELLLGEIGDIVRDAVRSKDTAYRWDETTFVLLLPGTDCSAATRLAERLRESIVRALLKEGVTISAGVACIPLSATDGDDLLNAASSAVADAQRHGRNQVRRAAVSADELATARDNVGRH